MGVPGLDEMMGGGLPRGYSLLVAGPSGFGQEHPGRRLPGRGRALRRNRRHRGLRAAPDRSRGRVLAELIESGAVGVIDARAPDLSIDEIVMLLIAEVRRLNATRVVIDSLSGFELALAPTFRDDFRESLLRLVTALAGRASPC